MRHLVASTEQVQNQMGKIYVLANQMGELAINQTNMSAQVAGMQGRIDSIDSRLIKVEEGNKDAPSSQAHPSTNGWGDMPRAPAASTSPLPPSPSSTPQAYDHSDRPMDPSVLRISNNQNKIALGAVGDAFADFFETINRSRDKFTIEGPELGNNSTLELMGTVAEAARRVQYILCAAKKDDGPPPKYWQFQAEDPSGELFPVLLNGDKNGHLQKLEGVTKRLCSSIKGKHPELLVCVRRSEGLLAINYKKFVYLDSQSIVY